MTNQNHRTSGPGLSLLHDDLDASGEQLPGGYMPALGAMVDGKYRIERLIARGGMGAVFAATHCVSGKKVALKWMLPALGRIPGARERFVREARATARIAHPNIVDIYDVGTEHDSVFLVMEYLRGETLADRLARMRLRPEEAIVLLMPALRGIAEAHRHGVIHRDLKPDNIFLCCTDSGMELEATVLDFGISKIADDELRELELTHSGTVLGTPYYMAPEQVRGARDVDVRADVYSIGVILFEVLAGQKPFDADTYNELILKIATEPPPQLSSLAPEVDPRLAAVVERAMARDADVRFHTIEELAVALEEFTGGIRFQGSRAPGFHTTLSSSAADRPHAIDAARFPPRPFGPALPNPRAGALAQLSIRNPALPAPLPKAPVLATDARGRVNVASIAIALTLCTGGAVYLARYGTPVAHRPPPAAVGSQPATPHVADAPASSVSSAREAPGPATSGNSAQAQRASDTVLSQPSEVPALSAPPATPVSDSPSALPTLAPARGSRAAKSAPVGHSPLGQGTKDSSARRRERTTDRSAQPHDGAARTSATASPEAQPDWDARVTVVPSQAASKPEAPAGSIRGDDF
jgi:eukaryotic-like serine/threonine-protein kinase